MRKWILWSTVTALLVSATVALPSLLEAEPAFARGGELAEVVGAVTRDKQALKQKIIDALRTIYDPEIPVNIYDLGLIYVVHIDDHNVVNVQMTLTAPACPVAGTLPGQVENVLREVEGVRDASVELVWDPPWDQSRMSEDARLTLGLL